MLADDGEILKPGSSKIGLIGTSGLVPVGYYKEEKSAETFKEVNGIRYSFPGDYQIRKRWINNTTWKRKYPYNLREKDLS